MLGQKRCWFGKQWHKIERHLDRQQRYWKAALTVIMSTVYCDTFATMLCSFISFSEHNSSRLWLKDIIWNFVVFSCSNFTSRSTLILTIVCNLIKKRQNVLNNLLHWHKNWIVWLINAILYRWSCNAKHDGTWSDCSQYAGWSLSNANTLLE